MKIKWLGHSCFLITAESGATLITDPYNTEAYPGTLLYDPIDEIADVVTTSHGHSDHGDFEAVGGSPEIVRAPGPREAAGFRIRGVPAFHDTQAGAMRGDVVMFVISADGLTVCHMGDIGEDELTPEQVREIGAVDVLLIPVGGNFTIDAATATRIWQQLSPPLAIPMHFHNDKCLFKIEGVEPFLAGKPDVERAEVSEIGLTKENLPARPKVIVLRHAR